jgi:spermidine synthase/S-adenosylmethionine decarboxylase
LLATGARLLAHTREACARAGLTVVGHALHEFAGGGYTFAVLLAESHITLHTWPEHACAAMDVYVCNHTRDNRAAAQAVAQAIVQCLQCAEPSMRWVERGEIAAPMEAVTP